MGYSHLRRLPCSAVACCLLSLPATTLPYAQAAKPIASPTDRPPRDWAVDVAANEVAVLQYTGSHLRYRMHTVDQKGDQTRDVIESKDGTVARLILRDGRPLTPEEDAAERQRLTDMLTSPAAFAKHVHNGESGKKMAAELIRMMPDAMIFTYAPDQPASGQSKDDEVVLDYHPNPGWKPPTTASAALTGLEGRLWVDVRTRQLVRMEGTVFKPVNFGWGMLARIYPGGQLTLLQTSPCPDRWIFSRFTQQVTVRALLLKVMNVSTEVSSSDFRVLPRPPTYQEAIAELLATPLPRP